MDMLSVRIITQDVDRLAAFYEALSGRTARRFTPDFAELAMPSCTLAIGHERTVAMFNHGAARAADNHSAILEFRVANVDHDFERLRPLVREFVQAPTTMPWGNRSLLLRDPDGNLINLFTPVAEPALSKYRNH